MIRATFLTAAVVASAALGGCSGSAHTSGRAASSDSSARGSDSSAGSVAAAEHGNLKANHMGRIPVLEYHVIGGATNGLYTRTIASFKADLEDVYKRGYRPITISQMLDKDFKDVPDGMSPVVFVFDDASPEQFRYIQQGDNLEIDPNSGIGIWIDFAKTHPGWNNRATFCLLSGAKAGHNFFGDSPRYEGQKSAWRFQKVKWLADNGFELCDHTVWHMRMDQYSSAQVESQIARNMMAIDSAVPGYKIRTIALPYGIWPKDKQVAWEGSWTDPKTGQAHPYHFDAVLEVDGGPTRSPYDPAFNPHSITRVQATGSDIPNALNALDRGTRFVK